jgi:hypothetical protein
MVSTDPLNIFDNAFFSIAVVAVAAIMTVVIVFSRMRPPIRQDQFAFFCPAKKLARAS